MKESSGTLLFRLVDKKPHVLIVRPSGPAARYGWSIPKGLPEPKESLEEAARRETLEETGCMAGELTYLGHIDYTKSRKRVHGFSGPAALNAEPRCASWEIDAARFVTLDEARKLLHPSQRALIDMLEKSLSSKS